jgi:hypothetical protein
MRFTKSISIKSNLAQEEVFGCFNVDFFQAMKLIYGYALSFKIDDRWRAIRPGGQRALRKEQTC